MLEYKRHASKVFRKTRDLGKTISDRNKFMQQSESAYSVHPRWVQMPIMMHRKE